MPIINKKDGKYFFTEHAQMKMKFYGISEQRVHRVIRAPQRVEEGIVEKTIAVMQPTSTKIKDGKKVWSSEIWCMYQVKNATGQQSSVISLKSDNPVAKKLIQLQAKQLKIISVWRYPGVSPAGNPVPEEILREIQEEVL